MRKSVSQVGGTAGKSSAAMEAVAVSDNSDSDDGKKDITVQIPSEDDVRYISAKIPIAQYEALDRLKDEYGMTWRGLLVHAQRELNGCPARDGSVDEEYELQSQ